MINVASRTGYSDAPKSARKHSHKKALRRHNRNEIIASATGFDCPQEEPTPSYDDLYCTVGFYVDFAVFKWDDGLDYNEDGTAYQDDAPGEHPHSYHHERADADAMVTRLLLAGVNPSRLRVAEDVWVPEWEACRIPNR